MYEYLRKVELEQLLSIQSDYLYLRIFLDTMETTTGSNGSKSIQRFTEALE